jgi:hypothetical protein
MGHDPAAHPAWAGGVVCPSDGRRGTLMAVRSLGACPVTGVPFPSLPERDPAEARLAGEIRHFTVRVAVPLRVRPTQPETSAEPLEISDFRYSTRSLISSEVRPSRKRVL